MKLAENEPSRAALDTRRGPNCPSPRETNLASSSPAPSYIDQHPPCSPPSRYCLAYRVLSILLYALTILVQREQQAAPHGGNPPLQLACPVFPALYTVRERTFDVVFFHQIYMLLRSLVLGVTVSSTLERPLSVFSEITEEADPRRGPSLLLVKDEDGAEPGLVVHHGLVRVLDLVEGVAADTFEKCEGHRSKRTREPDAYVSMRVSTPVVMAKLIMSSDAEASPDGQPRTDKRF